MNEAKRKAWFDEENKIVSFHAIDMQQLVHDAER